MYYFMYYIYYFGFLIYYLMYYFWNKSQWSPCTLALLEQLLIQYFLDQTIEEVSEVTEKYMSGIEAVDEANKKGDGAKGELKK